MVDFGVMVCIVMSIAQLLKKMKFNTDIIPLLNLLTGVILSVIFFQDVEIPLRLQQGLIIGLSASGTYDACASFRE